MDIIIQAAAPRRHPNDMDVTFTNVLEGARQYFQGLPAAPSDGVSSPESSTKNLTPEIAEPVEPEQQSQQQQEPVQSAADSMPPQTRQAGDQSSNETTDDSVQTAPAAREDAANVPIQQNEKEDETPRPVPPEKTDATEKPSTTSSSSSPCLTPTAQLPHIPTPNSYMSSPGPPISDTPCSETNQSTIQQNESKSEDIIETNKSNVISEVQSNVSSVISDRQVQNDANVDKSNSCTVKNNESEVQLSVSSNVNVETNRSDNKVLQKPYNNTTDVQSLPLNLNETANEVKKSSREHQPVLENSKSFSRNDRQSTEENYHLSYKMLQASREHPTPHFGETQSVRSPFQTRPSSNDTRTNLNEIRPSSREIGSASTEARQSIDVRSSSTDVQPLSSEIKVTPNERICLPNDTKISSNEIRHLPSDARIHLNEGRAVINDSRITQVHEGFRPPSLESRITQIHELRPVQTYDYRPVQDERTLVTLEPRINSTEARPYDVRSASINSNSVLYNKPYSTNQDTQENRPASVEYISTQHYRPPEGRSSSQEIKQQYDNKMSRRPISNEQRPSSRGSRPQSHEFRPPSHEMRPSSHEMRPPSHEMRPPSHEMRPPSHEMRPPSHEMRPPSHEVRPPSHEMRPVSHDMRPPPHEIRPPSHEMRPTSQEIRSQEMKPISQEIRSSHEIRTSHEIRPSIQETRPSQEQRPSSQDVRLISHDVRSYHEIRPAHELRIPLQDMRHVVSHERLPVQDMRNIHHEMKQSSSQEIKQVPQDTRPPSNRDVRQVAQEHSKHVPNQDFHHSTHASDLRQQQVAQEFRTVPQELRVSQNTDYRQSHDARIAASYDNRQVSRDYRVLNEYQRTPAQAQDVRTHQPEIRAPVQDSRTINARVHDNRTYSHQVPIISQEYRPPVPHEQSVSVRTSTEQNTTNDARLYRSNYEYLPPTSHSRNLSVYPQMISKSKTSSGEQTPHINSQSFSQAMSRVSAETNSAQHHNQQSYYIPSKQSSAIQQHSVKMIPNPYVQNSIVPASQQNVSDSRLNHLYIQSKPSHTVHDLTSGNVHTYASAQNVKQVSHMNNHQIQHRTQEYERRIQTQGYPTTEQHIASKVKDNSTKNVTNYQSQVTNLNRSQEQNLMGYPGREINESPSHNLKYNQMPTTHLASRSQETSQASHTYPPQLQSTPASQQNTTHHQPHASVNYQPSIPQRSTYSNTAVSSRNMNQQYAIPSSQSSQYLTHGTQITSNSSHSTTQYPYPKVMQNIKSSQSQETTYPTPQVQTSQSLKVTHNLPPIAALSSSANYLNKTNRDASHRLSQKQRTSSSSSMNTQQYLPKSHAVPENTSKNYLQTPNNYNPSSISHTMSSYHNQSANGYPYVTTIAQSHSMTTTTSTSTGTIPSSSYAIHPNHYQHAKPALQEALIKRQQASQNPSKLHQSQSHPTLTSLGRTSTETHYGTTHNGQLRSDIAATALNSRIPVDSAQRSSKTKRESPLDLSVKTVRTSADSTADDDIHIIEQRTGKHSIQASRPHLPNQNTYDQRMANHRMPPIATTVTAPRVDFSPDFSLNNTNSRNVADPKLNVPRHSFDNKSYNNQPINSRKLINDKTYDNRMPAYYQTLAQSQRMPLNNTQVNVQGAQGSNAYTPITETTKRTDGLPRVEFPPLNQNHNIYQSSTSSKDMQRKRMGEPVIPVVPNKIPRVDTWRQTIDQEIDQRLQLKKKELQQKEAQAYVNNQSIINGHINASNQQVAAPAHRTQIDVPHQYMNQYRPQLHQKVPTQSVHAPMSHQQQAHLQPPQSQTISHPPYSQTVNQPHPQVNHLQTTHQQAYAQAENMYQQHQNQTNMPQNNHSSNQNLSRSNSHSKLQHAGLPNHSVTNNVGPGADIRVINLLRTSLEKKEAKEAQKRIEQERMNANDVSAMQNRIRPTFQQPSTEVTAPIQAKPPSIGRHNLPPFQASSMLEAASQPMQKFHLPRAVDSVRLEMRNGIATPVNEKYAEVKTSPPLDNNYPVASVPPPTSIPSNADLDGLAANLAARIRTKAELKQVDPSQLQVNRANSDETQVTSTPNEDIKSETDVQLSASTDGTSSNGTPPKLISERIPVLPRRRLFSRPEEEHNHVTGSTTAAAVSQRDSSLRSSSETSVFDFPDSDSEAETHVLDISLDDLRRDRKSLIKQGPSNNIEIEPPVIELPDPPVIKEEICDDPPDPFFSATCDKLLEQLRTGPKKRGRRKKIVEPDVLAKLETVTKERPLSEIEIKVEKCDDVLEKIETSGTMEIKKEVIEMIEPKQEPIDDIEFKKDEDSDSDVPLIGKKSTLDDMKEKVSDVSDDSDDDNVIRIKRKDGAKKSGAKIKIESSSESSSDSDSDQNPETVADRLRQRKRQSGKALSEKGMSLRPRETTPQKGRSKPTLQKKPSFGDGSDFRPGWEEEVYKYKQSLRMPAQLINIARPTRVSSSLPDLDPCPSPVNSSITDNDFFQQRPAISNNLFGSSKTKFELFDSDIDSNSSFSLIHNKNLEDSEEATSSSLLSSTSKTNTSKFKGGKNSNSIVDLLAQRCGKNKRKKTKKDINTRPKIIPRATSPLELLPTPSLGIGSSNKEEKKNAKGKLKKLKQEELDNVSQDSVYLGSFRKNTINNFRYAFLKNAKSETIPAAFKPIVLNSRTRKETLLLKQRATRREVFGEDRPASAPPMTNHEDIKKEIPIVKPPEIKKKPVPAKTAKTRQKDFSGTPGRAGLRSAVVLRGNRTILTKRIIPAGRKKSMIKALEAKKLKLEMKRQLKGGKVAQKEGKQSLKEEKIVIKEEKVAKEEKLSKDDRLLKDERPTVKVEKMIMKEELKIELTSMDASEVKALHPPKKRMKLKAIRRKFSSGFDYIRKKKKQVKKEKIPTEGVIKIKKKRVGVQRSNAESVQDIQREIKGWVLNKGIGETHLHRAARLGYTDVTAYCLETLNNRPSPKDNAGYTPLHEACSRGHLDIAKLLLLYGANVHESAKGGIRPLHEATENGYVEIIRLLLAYGADPSLATYSGYTPMSLATDGDSLGLLQNYMADIQGKESTPWRFQGPAVCFDTEEKGYDALEGAPSPDPESSEEDFVAEECEIPLPNLYTLRGDNPNDRWVLMQDLLSLLKIKSKDALLRQINPPTTSSQPSGPINHKNVLRELKMADFLEQAQCTHMLWAGERVNTRGSKVVLIRYNDRVKQLLGVERSVIQMR